jgi:hypothetical protein
MHITAYSYEIKGGTEFYCYLKSASGAIGEAVGAGFIRAFTKAIVKLFSAFRRDATLSRLKQGAKP